jgi:hypothetical protein
MRQHVDPATGSAAPSFPQINAAINIFRIVCRRVAQKLIHARADHELASRKQVLVTVFA